MSVLVINDGGIGVINALVVQVNALVADVASLNAAIVVANHDITTPATTAFTSVQTSVPIVLKR